MNTDSPSAPGVVVLRQVPHEGAGTLAGALAAAGLAWRYVDWFGDNIDRQFDPRTAAGLVVLGGPMNVDQTDRYPFLATEVRWIEQALAAELPVLGICLGSQLLAKSLGSPVRANAIKEIGWYEVEFTPAASDDPLFAGAAPRETIFQWHGDTFDLPAGAVQLACSAQCQQQAFRFGRSAWGLQFHLEVTPAIVEQWLSEDGFCGELASLSYIDPAAIRRATPGGAAAMAPLATRVLGRFAELCRARAEAVVAGR
jgi:GMP synthase (glutamine-hydrolysing)